MGGAIAVNITPQAIAMRNLAGVTAQWTLSLYECWREGKILIALALRSGTFLPLNLAELSDLQRNELRGNLEQMLPKS
jgi:hypothetical protein